MGLRQLYSHRPDLVIVDLVLPGMDGFETTRRIRQLADIPVIVVSGLDEEESIVRGLGAGAVEYVTKPFSESVLIARIRAVLRTISPKADRRMLEKYEDQYLTIDVGDHRVFRGGERVKLTSTEFNLLALLLRNADRVCTMDHILEQVWGWNCLDCKQYVYTYVGHLRKKIEPDPRQPQYIVAEHGVGYRFVRQL
jgi:two-component system KDP operon response regulator KdpE